MFSELGWTNSPCSKNLVELFNSREVFAWREWLHVWSDYYWRDMIGALNNMCSLSKALPSTLLLAFALLSAGHSASAHDSFCQQFGAEAVITTSRMFVTTLPASTFAVNPELLSGCVVRRKYWSELRRKLLITPAQERHCSKAGNTFAYTRDDNGEITTYCVDHIYN